WGPSRSDRFAPSLFNFYREAARALWAEQPLDWAPIAAGSGRHAHLVLLGLGQMGEHVALQAARLAHFASGEQLRLTVVDRAAGERVAALAFHYPGLGRVCRIDAVQSTAEDPAVVARLRAIAEDARALLTVAVCFDSDLRSLDCGLRLARELRPLDCRLRVRSPGQSLLPNLAGCASTAGPCAPGPRVTLFGHVDAACRAEWLLADGAHGLARPIHERYRRARLAAGADPADPALRPWDELDDVLRSSNLHQADHLGVKLRAVACSWRPLAPGAPAPGGGGFFSAAEVELLARMEHDRWNAERWLAGWTLGPRDPAGRVSPHLVAWDELSEEVREYDRETVRLIPRLVSMWRDGGPAGPPGG
ncbi:MAG: RyR domain-containing protein, partial [Deferrisomatales bacterium]